MVRREGQAPLPFPVQPYVPAIESLEDICSWLGTFRSRLRQARGEERVAAEPAVQRPEAHSNDRRAELS